jgi:hypothetical protein
VVVVVVVGEGLLNTEDKGAAFLLRNFGQPHGVIFQKIANFIFRLVNCLFATIFPSESPRAAVYLLAIMFHVYRVFGYKLCMHILNLILVTFCQFTSKPPGRCWDIKLKMLAVSYSTNL